MWNTTISIQKSVYASFINSREERQIEARLFKEEEHIKTVGLTIFKDGLNPRPALKAIIARAAQRAKALLAPQGGLPLRFDVLSFLYDKFALSILAHSRPFIQAETFNCRSLQSAQDSFSLEALQLHESTTPLFAASELGIYDMDLACAKDALLLHHRLSSNTTDTITSRLLLCPITTLSQNSHDIAQLDLHRLGILQPIALLLKTHYIHFKARIKSALHSTQQSRYTNNLNLASPIYASMRFTKPYWGLDRSLFPFTTKEAILYIHLRLQNFPSSSVSPTNVGCKYCMTPLSTVHHTLWTCPVTLTLRHTFLSSLQTEFPAIYLLIKDFVDVQPILLTTFFSGGALMNLSIPQWTPPLRLFMSFLTSINDRITRAPVSAH